MEARPTSDDGFIVPDLRVNPALEARAQEILEQAKGMAVHNTTTYLQAGDVLRSLKDVIVDLEADVKPVVDVRHKLHKEATEWRSELLAPYKTAERIIDAKLRAYRDAATLEKQRTEEAIEKEYGQAVSLPDPTPALSGVSLGETWKATVVDFPKLVQAVAKGEAPIEVLLPNQPELNRLARALKKTITKKEDSNG